MKFLKEAFSVFIVHVGSSIISFFVAFGVGAAMYGWWFVLTIPLLLFIYSIPIATKMRAIGQRDRNAIGYGHAARKPFKGLWLALAANSPNIIMALLLLVAKAGYLPNYLILFRFLNPQISPLLLLTSESVFLPELSWMQLVAFVLYTFIPVILAAAYYVFGLNDFSIKEKILYKKNPDKKM